MENGADAVYLGAKAFSARASATNFTDDELRRGIEYAHGRGVSVYLTMNTLVGDGEMAAAVDAAGGAWLAGADALIVQDLGLARVLRTHLPKLPLHMSTQGTVLSLEGIRALAPLGFSRFILARELPMERVAAIVSASDIPVEVFVHGALCVCYSGQCHMSSMIGARSGNRGRCAQPCRLPYSLGKIQAFAAHQSPLISGDARPCGATGNALISAKPTSRVACLSPKDLCALEQLPALVQAGVAALKIEGRLKSPDYVAVVTHIYRKTLDRIAEGLPSAVSQEDLNDLAQVFNRGFTAGWLGGARGESLSDAGPPGHRGVPEPDPTLAERARRSFEGIHKRIPVHGRFTAAVGQPLFFHVWDDEGHSAQAASPEPAQAARTQPLTAEAAREQLDKTGPWPFTLADCETTVDGVAAAPKSALNALRREALDALLVLRENRYPERLGFPSEGKLSPQATDEVVLLAGSTSSGASRHLPGRRGEQDAQHPASPLKGKASHGVNSPVEPQLSVVLTRWRPDLAPALAEVPRVFAPLDDWLKGTLPANVFPRIPFYTDLQADRPDAVAALHECRPALALAGSAGHLAALAQAGVAAVADYTLNAYNAETLQALAALGFAGATLSHELTMAQIRVMGAPPLPLETAVYGRLPLMVSRHCVLGRNRPGCSACTSGGASLTDRRGAAFPLAFDRRACVCTILNGDVLAVPQLAAPLGRVGVSWLRLYIHDEPPEAVAALLARYAAAARGEPVDPPSGKGYTKGHYFRGV